MTTLYEKTEALAAAATEPAPVQEPAPERDPFMARRRGGLAPGRQKGRAGAPSPSTVMSPPTGTARLCTTRNRRRGGPTRRMP